MKKIFSILVCLSLFCGSASAQSWQLLTEAQGTEVVNQINGVHKKLKGIQSKFKQTKESAMLKEPLVSEGNMEYAAASNYIKWEYVTPFYSCFEMKNNKVSVKQSKDAKKSTGTPGAKMFQGLAQFMLNSFNGKGLTDKKNFNYQVYRSGNAVSAWLTPKKAMMKKALKMMKMYFNGKTQMVDKIEIIGANGDITTIEFLNMKIEK